MRPILTLGALGAIALSLGACASDGYGSRYGSSRYYDGDRYASRCERNQSNRRAAATVGGAAVGALAGSAIAGNSSNTEGAIAGGVIGGIIGNQATKSPREACRY
jgi:outer membrane lipoprotein SlyB